MFTAPKDSQINPKLIQDAIAYNETFRLKYDVLDRYYLGRHSIIDRFKATNLKNNRVVINHAKYITNVNIGYLLGNPVEYQIKEKVDIAPVLEEYNKQTISNVDHQIAKDCSKFGTAFDYTYALENNDVHTKRIDARNAVMIYDDTMEHEKTFGIIYGQVTGKKYKEVTVLDKNSVYTLDEDLNIIDTKPHSFGEVPLNQYFNNEEMVGDYEDVLSLIDAYNLLQSDRINDKEQLVEAILVLYGITMTDKQMDGVRRNRVLTVPKDGKVEYLLKALNEGQVDILRARIEADIHKISMTPNLSDENFVGNSSGVAIRYKIIGFEQNIKNKERAFEVGLMQRFRLYSNYLSKLNKMDSVEVYKVDAIFKRNLPQNDFEISQMINNLTGLVSPQTLLGQLSFIENADDEVKWAEQEAIKNANMESPDFGKNPSDSDSTENDDDTVMASLNEKVLELLTNNG